MYSCKYQGKKPLTRQINSDASLDVVLGQLEIASKGIAIAVNQEIIPRDKWGETKLNKNDKVLVIKATQGG